MRHGELDMSAMERACRGDREAMDFLVLWAEQVHRVDDIIDGERTDAEFLLATLARAAVLYSHPFYLKHLGELRAVAMLVTDEYANAVGWEKATEDWQRQWADAHRHAGIQMLVAVAQICGGFEHGRRVSIEHQALAWIEHHDREGKAE